MLKNTFIKEHEGVRVRKLGAESCLQVDVWISDQLWFLFWTWNICFSSAVSTGSFFLTWCQTLGSDKVAAERDDRLEKCLSSSYRMFAALRAKRTSNNMTATLFNLTPTENIQRENQMALALKWNENKFLKKPTVSGVCVYRAPRCRSACYSFHSAEASQRTEEETSGSPKVWSMCRPALTKC